MYECSVRAEFHAAHQLRLADGTTEPLHAHNWKVEAVFRGSQLDGVGVLVDFVAVQQALGRILEPLAGSDVGAASLVGGLNPTAENVARRIFEALQAALGAAAPLAAVYVEEAPGCIAGYSPAA